MAAKRLLISLEDTIWENLQTLAKMHKSSLSSTARELLVSGLEMEEDLMFSKIADQRIADTKKWYSHKDAWGK